MYRQSELQRQHVYLLNCVFTRIPLILYIAAERVPSSIHIPSAKIESNDVCMELGST